MKYFLLVFIIGVFSIQSCTKPDEPKLITSCSNGYIANEDSTECICPKATHYEIVPTKKNNNPFCKEKGEFNYLLKIKGKNCFMESENIYDNEIGFIRFSSNDQIFIDFASSSISHFNFTHFKKIVHDNGEVEVSFNIKLPGMGRCNNWKKITNYPSTIEGYAHGISNKENTKMEIRIEYKDYKDKLIDIGYMQLWKE